jgi:hypothetical protein
MVYTNYLIRVIERVEDTYAISHASGQEASHLRTAVVGQELSAGIS